MRCSYQSSSSPCQGNLSSNDIIFKYHLDMMEKEGKKGRPFNMEEIKRISTHKICLCEKHLRQHNKILRLIISGSYLFDTITAENIDTLV